jgi:hypothetical protein
MTNRAARAGEVQTVLGLVAPEALGVTMTPLGSLLLRRISH